MAESESDASRPSRRGRGPLARATLAFASDERLAKRAAAGDPDAFATIFRRYGQDLYRFCVGILREPQDAQDAVQNTMMKAMRALPGETRDMQLRPWLYRIAHNEAVELRRGRRPAEPLGPMIDVGAGTEERVEQDTRLRTLLADIADLPERQRASLVMRELSGLGFGEIGAALETSPGAARQALYEARRGLSQMEQGRDMDCETAMRQVSDEDGAPRRRDVRAHLRDCARCRRFQAEIRDREEILAAISPLPLVLVATLVKGSLGGSVGGAAGGAAGAAGGAGVGAASAVGVGGGGVGVAAGSVGASTLVKGAAGLLAALALGTGAADHGGLVSFGDHHPRHPGGDPAHVREAEAAVAGGDVARRSGGGPRMPRQVPAGAELGSRSGAPGNVVAPARAVSRGGDGSRRLAAHDAGVGPSATSAGELATSDGNAGDSGVPTEPEGKGAGNGKGVEKSQGKGGGNSEGNGSEGGNGFEKGNGGGSQKGNGKGAGRSEGKAPARSNGKGSAKAQGKGSEKSRGSGVGKSAGKGAQKSAARNPESSPGKGAEKGEAEHLTHPGGSKQEVAVIPPAEAEATVSTVTAEPEPETASEGGGGKGKAKKEAESPSE